MNKQPCSGSLLHGNACGLCDKCKEELARLKKSTNPDVTEATLDDWAKAAEDRELVEIVRLARVGLWAEKNSVQIDEALRTTITCSTRQPRRDRMRETLTSRPRR